jgi:phospholipid/cholesterol/gamma-HCH transport system substrate-binding protein
VVAAVDPKKVGSAVDSVQAFAQTLRDHRQDVDAIVQNAKDLTARLDDTSKKLGGLIDNANAFLGQGQKSGVFAQVGDAAKSIKTLADHLDKRTKKLTDELSGFTGPGLRSLQAALGSVRAAAQSIEEVARELERNPQRFLFGGARVRDYPSGG